VNREISSILLTGYFYNEHKNEGTTTEYDSFQSGPQERFQEHFYFWSDKNRQHPQFPPVPEGIR
jgi:hypothetical protein